MYANVSNAAGATIITSGGGTTTFWDNVSNGGLIRTSTGCTSAFFGTVTLSGTGIITGPGITDLEGPHPGVVPMIVSVPSGSPAVSAPVLLSGDALIDTAGSLAISGPISGGHALTKLGDGQLILSGTNSYTGGTICRRRYAVTSERQGPSRRYELDRRRRRRVHLRSVGDGSGDSCGIAYAVRLEQCRNQEPWRC